MAVFHNTEAQRRMVKRHYPLIISIIVLLLITAALLVSSARLNQGRLIYPFDDPYIHMAVAKNFAQHGVWGVTKYGFSSSSSSLLYPLLLSFGYLICGLNEISPFIINLIFGIAVCILSYALLPKDKAHSFLILVILLSMILATPLFALILYGQEHTLHLLITIAFVFISAKMLSAEKDFSRERIILLVLSPLLTMSRYEGIFLLFVVCGLFIIKRRPSYAVLLGATGLLPIAAYGVISLSKGWYFLPNSIVLKGIMPFYYSWKSLFRNFGYRGYETLVGSAHILFLILPALIIYILRFYKHRSFWEDKQLMIVIFVLTTFLHMQYAQVGWFYRYEAYLVGLGILIVGILTCEYFPKKFNIKINQRSIHVYIAWIFLGIFAMNPFYSRYKAALDLIPQATNNIYEQQYQMGLFLKEFYQGKAIAANDIGAINYLADIKTVDLWGLSSMEVLRARKKGLYDTEYIFKLTAESDVRIAVIYNSWFTGKMHVPLKWVEVGQWKLRNNKVGGSDTVSFYAVDSSYKDKLITDLKAFSSRLPKDVIQSGAYTS